MDRWDIRTREIKMDNSQKSQIWLNGIGVGEIVNRFEAVDKLKDIFEQYPTLKQSNEQLQQILSKFILLKNADQNSIEFINAFDTYIKQAEQLLNKEG